MYIQDCDPPIDILDIDENYICSCRVDLYDEHNLYLKRIPGKKPLPNISGPIKIRGYRNGQPIDLTGNVLESEKNKLNVTNIKITEHENKRKYIRYTIQENSTFIYKNKLKTCKLINISLGGACIECKHKLKLQDELYVKFAGMKILGSIIRITEKDNKKYEYGIIFKPLSPEHMSNLQNILWKRSK